MLRVHRTVEYALIALRYMDVLGSEQFVSAREIADVHELPYELVAKILQRMTQAGYLASQQGPRGGYRTTADLGRVSFLELEAAVGGRQVATEALARADSAKTHHSSTNHGGESGSPGSLRALATPMEALSRRITEVLAATTVADLLAEAHCPEHGTADTDAAKESILQ